MGFTKKTWKNRIAEYINRRRLTMEDGSTNLVTVARDEGTISQEGDAFNAANMNDLEDRIEAGFEEVSQSLSYSTDEVSTGYKWIDGKKIFKKSIRATNLSSTAGKLVNIGTYPFNETLNEVVKLECLITAINGVDYCSFNSALASVGFSKLNKAIEVVQGIGSISFNCVVTIFYTKTI